MRSKQRHTSVLTKQEQNRKKRGTTEKKIEKKKKINKACNEKEIVNQPVTEKGGIEIEKRGKKEKSRDSNASLNEYIYQHHAESIPRCLLTLVYKPRGVLCKPLRRHAAAVSPWPLPPHGGKAQLFQRPEETDLTALIPLIIAS